MESTTKKDKVLCRFSPGVLFLPARLHLLSADTAEVEHPRSGEIVTFRRPSSGGCSGQEGEFEDLDVVVDDIPSETLITLNRLVLTPNFQTGTSMCYSTNEDGFDGYEQVCGQANSPEGTYMQCRIIDKKFRPLRAKVMYSNGETAWFRREEMRVMEPPWIARESVEIPGCEAGDACSSPAQRGQQKRDYRQRSSIPAKAYKYGDIVRLRDGMLKKYNGKRWRRLCVHSGCTNYVRLRGLCNLHLGGKSNPIKARSGTNSDISEQPGGNEAKHEYERTETARDNEEIRAANSLGEAQGHGTDASMTSHVPPQASCVPCVQTTLSSGGLQHSLACSDLALSHQTAPRVYAVVYHVYPVVYHSAGATPQFSNDYVCGPASGVVEHQKPSQ